MSKRIPFPKKAKKNVKNNTKPYVTDNLFVFDFRNNKWLKGVKVDKFTNKIKDSESYSKLITTIMGTIIPEFQSKSEDILKARATGFNCHAIEQGQDAYNTVLKVIKKIHGEHFEKTILQEEEIYQIGVTGGIRIITLRNKSNNVIKPVFIDYYHLAYPDVKYNQTDYLSQEICPLDTYL